MFRPLGAAITGLFLVSLPVVASVYLAHWEALQLEYQRVGLMAHTVLDRTEAVDRESRAAIKLLNEHEKEGPCSPANIALMREIDLGSPYLQAVGYVANNRLMCSSLGDHGVGIPIGPVQVISPYGEGIRPRVRLPMLAGKELIVEERNGNATFLHPDLITDVVPRAGGLWAGIVNLSQRRPMIVHGEFRIAWLARTPLEGRDAYFSDGGRLVAMYRPPNYDYIAFAAAPSELEQQQARALAWRLGPGGAVIGALLWLSIRWKVRRLRSLPAVMRAALRAGEFSLEYQPIVDLATGRWAGAEALMRWRRPDGSRIRPDVFIPVAEDSGLITRITERAIALVASEAGALLERHPEFYISLNLSSADLADERTLHLLGDLVRRPGFAPRNIVVEATERSLLSTELTRRILEGIRELGIRAAIDDFGTGYSGLSYLGTFKFDALKIDKAFVDTVGTDAATSNVAVHIIEMAKALGLQMVAEGIEHEAQASFLKERGVHYGQGWLYAESMTMQDLVARMNHIGT